MEDKKLASILETSVDLESRVIYIFGEINDEVAYKTIVGLALLAKNENFPIKVVISSPGGLETAGYAIYDALMSCKNVIEMVGMGTVSSIAAAIFQAGDVRKMQPNCDYLIHDGIIGVGGEIEQNKIINVAEQIKKNNTKYYEILSNGSRLKLEDVEKACKAETIFSAQECLEYGFCDEIIKTKIRLPMKKKRSKKKSEV